VTGRWVTVTGKRRDCEVLITVDDARSPSSDDAHEVVFFRRHRDDDPDQAIPGRESLNACPVKVRATMRAVLTQVAAAPPKRFAGGGYWEAMKGDMGDGSRSASTDLAVTTTGSSAA
jgi:hypothetical protein